MVNLQSESFFSLSRRGLARLAVSALPAVLLTACATSEPPPLPQRLDLPYDEGRIWKVEGEGIKHGYVFGTFHISDPKVLDIPSVVESAFVESSIAAFEYDYDPAKEEENRIDRKRYELPEDTTLRSLIGSGTFGRLTDIFSGLGYWRPRNDLKPWVMWDYLGGTRGTFYSSDDESNRHRPVLDDWLQTRARDEGKEVVGLETVEEGFVKYDTIPMDHQVVLLKSVVEHYRRHRAGAPIVQSYVDGDLGMLMAFWQETLDWYPPEVGEEINFRILDNRNRIMVERMLPLMEREVTFVAVGAGHLAGEKGILRMLEERGYTLTRLH